VRQGRRQELPSAALGDPDVERFVLLDVEVLCDLLCRFDGNRMLLGATSEDDPTFNLRMLDLAFELQAVDDGVLDGVAQAWSV